jgi:L-serine dehydratase
MIGFGDIFKVGIGPSSSHTVGPMKAAASFVSNLGQMLSRVTRLRATAYGSLAWTGRGHATDKALLLGLAGCMPANLDPDYAESLFAEIKRSGRLTLPGGRTIPFDFATDIILDLDTTYERHPNAMAFEAFDADGSLLTREVWFSVGGGFVVREGAEEDASEGQAGDVYPFRSAADLLAIGERTRLTIAEIVLANETARRSLAEVEAEIDRVAEVMFACIERGLSAEGELPGGLKVMRRARSIRERLEADARRNFRAPHEVMDWVSLFAIAVNEENAAGGRVVTAPTNGAAGVVPAVLRYYRDFCPGANQKGMRDFLLTATAIAALFKMNASISGAEVGCQGEVGVACSMAAAGLAAALGGTNAQIENAAEIGMEHHLGLTCDPIGGLVQIPCIERNAFGAVKAVNAASLALRSDGVHKVSLDQVIATMRQTGADMQAKYKETSLGGLAVNYTEC